MRRKLLSLILAVSVILSCGFVAFAKEGDSQSKGNINRNTIITRNNINDILKHYGIDPGTAKKNYKSADNKIVTVGDLEDALNILAQQPKQTKINENLSYNDNERITANGISISGTKWLYSTSYPSSNFGLESSVLGYYISSSSYKIWTDATDPYIRIVGTSAPGTKYDIGRVNRLAPSNTSDKVTLNSNIVIYGYVIIGIPNTPFCYEYKVSEFGVTSTTTWGTSYIP